MYLPVSQYFTSDYSFFNTSENSDNGKDLFSIDKFLWRNQYKIAVDLSIFNSNSIIY
jgi:hypothetical protein